MRRGDRVLLLTRPDGCSARELPLTPGRVYEVLGLDAGNVVTTCDEPGREASYWRGRVIPAAELSQPKGDAS